MTVLVQWLWQGTVVAFGLAIALRLAPGVNAATRYALWWLALATVLLLPIAEPIITFLCSGWPSVVHSGMSGIEDVDRPMMELPTPPDWVTWATRSASRSPRTSPSARSIQAEAPRRRATSPAAWLTSCVVRSATRRAPCGWIAPGIWIGSRAQASRSKGLTAVSAMGGRPAEAALGVSEARQRARHHRICVG